MVWPVAHLEQIALHPDRPAEALDKGDPPWVRRWQWNLLGASLERYPGAALLKRGYINLAGDSSGSGHPYFFPTDRGDDPPVYRFTYEVGDNVDVMIARRGVCVSGRLSDLLRAAPVMVWNEETASWTGVFGRIGE